jgi:hypothetical protein
MYHRSECHIPSTTISGETWYAVAWLTVPEHVVRDELQVLVHGATYDHRYPGNFTFEVVPGAGHNLNLHRQAHDAYRSTQKWLDALVV